MLNEEAPELYMRYSDAPGALQHLDCQAITRCKARILQSHIGRLESLHSSLRRQTTQNSVQTHVADEELTIAKFVVHRIQKQPLSMLIEDRSKLEAASRTAGAEGDATAVANSARATHTDGRFVGPFRLFAREMTFGHTGGCVPDMRSVGEAYHR